MSKEWVTRLRWLVSLVNLAGWIGILISQASGSSPSQHAWRGSLYVIVFICSTANLILLYRERSFEKRANIN